MCIRDSTTAIRKYTLNLMNRDSVIVESKLKERAGIIGACMLSDVYKRQILCSEKSANLGLFS